MNHYQTLGVPPNADDHDIKQAYYARAKTAHPDTDTGSKEKFQEVQEAYAVLSNRIKRQEYDAEISLAERPRGNPAGYPQDIVDIVLGDHYRDFGQPEAASSGKKKKKGKKRRVRYNGGGSGRPEEEIIPDGFGFDDTMDGLFPG